MTYKQIQACYKRRFNKTIKTCWIADVKRQLGLRVRNSYNRKAAIILNRCPQHLVEQIAKVINGQKTYP